MKHIWRSFSLALILLGMLACGGGSNNPPNNPTPGTLSGTLLAPSGGDVNQTLLIACFIQSNTCDINSTNTQSSIISSSGDSTSFQFNNLADGQYAIFAFKDLNGDEDFGDDEDYSGCYGSAESCSLVSPPANNLSVQLELNAPDAPPVVPGSISGTLLLPGRSEAANLLTQAQDLAQARQTSEIRAGEVIVKFKDTGLGSLATTEPLRNYRFQNQGLSRSRLLGLERTALYKAELSVEQTYALIADLNARSDVEYAEPNYIMHMLKTPNDRFYDAQWHYPAMNLENAWDMEDGTSNPVTVAVVDTGAIPHPDLAGTFVGGFDFISVLEISGDGDGRDADPTDLGQESGYHGAHVAGTVAAQTNNGIGLAGVSWGAKVVPIRVLGINGSGTLADIVDGTLWAGGESITGIPNNPNPAKVINLSLGGERPCSSTEDFAFETLKNKGIVVVVAAGNNNTNAGFFSPASCSNVITVGATGPQGQRAPYSNFGLAIDVMATGGDTNKSILFEGRQISAGVYSTIKDDNTGEFIFAPYQGTSMAAPHIAGIAALMLSKEPSLTPDQILARLVDAATPLTASQCGRPSANECGAGLVDAAAALGSSSNTPPPPPPPSTAEVDTYVAAFFCANIFCSDFDLDLSKLITLSNVLQETPYQITDLLDGAYVVAGWQDLNSDSLVNEGEPFGIYRNNSTDDLVFLEDQGVSGIDVQLEPFIPSTGVPSTGTDTLLQTLMSQALSQAQRSLPLLKDESGFERFLNP